MLVYSYSYWLVIFSTTNISRALARERWQTFEKNTIFNEHPVFLFDVAHKLDGRELQGNIMEAASYKFMVEIILKIVIFKQYL